MAVELTQMVERGMKRVGWSQSELARRLGQSQPSVNQRLRKGAGWEWSRRAMRVMGIEVELREVGGSVVLERAIEGVAEVVGGSVGDGGANSGSSEAVEGGLGAVSGGSGGGGGARKPQKSRTAMKTKGKVDKRAKTGGKGAILDAEVGKKGPAGGKGPGSGGKGRPEGFDGWSRSQQMDWKKRNDAW